MEATIDRPAAVYTDTIGAAAILCVAPKTLRNWASLGAGPDVFRLNGATRPAGPLGQAPRVGWVGPRRGRPGGLRYAARISELRPPDIWR